MRPIFLLLLFGLCTMTAFGQKQKSTFDLFSDAKPEPAEKTYKQVTEGTLLTIDLEELKALREAAPNHFSIDLPQADGSIMELHLGKVNIFAKDFKVETSIGSRTDDVDLGIHYKGVVAGHSSSLVTVSIYEQELVALFSDGRYNYELAKLKSEADRYILFKTSDLEERLKQQLMQFECHIETEGRDLPEYTEDQLSGVSDSRNGCQVIQVYLVADFSYYTVCGSDLTETTNRLTAVFAQTMNIYTAEDINMVMSGIMVWQTEDNAFEEDSSAEFQRNQFRDYYNTTGDGWPGDLAQLISGTSTFGTGAGGIAFFDGLCTSDSYALTRAGGSSPIVDWTMYSRFVKVLTHEIGHNLNSRHTHACVWNGDNTTIDDYGNVSPGGNPFDDPEGEACLEEPYKLDVFPTIMSYFDSRNHGTFDMTNGMGEQPGNVMRDYVMNAGCLDDGSNVPPVARCQDVTVQLDANGDGSTTAAAVDDGSYDACGDIEPLELSQTSFDCTEIEEENTEFLTVTDLDGNISYCFLTVTVEDNVPPSAQCQNVTVQLDANGNGSTTAMAVNNGSSDACGIQTISLTQVDFDCDEVGANIETLKFTDNNGNISTCDATVTVEDNIKPTAVCLNPTVELQPDGLYTLLLSDIFDDVNSNDNCSISSTDFPAVTYTCDDADLTFSVLLTIEDPSGNTDDCTAMVTVEIGKALPPPWTANDIGDQGDGSSYAYDPCANEDPSLGSFTISTGGFNHIFQNSDNMAFASVSICGDFSMKVRIDSLMGDSGYGGLMARESSAPGSKQVSMLSNLTSLVRWESRQVTDGAKQATLFDRPFHTYLRLSREGNLVRGFSSTTGNSLQLVNAIEVDMNTCLEVGLSVFTNDPSGETTAVFSELVYSGNNCSPDPLFLNDSPVIAKTYRSASTIESAGEVASSSVVSFTAGESIALKPGFRAAAGSAFTARIEECEPFTEDPMDEMQSNDETAEQSGNFMLDRRKNEEVLRGTDHLKVFPNPLSNQTTIELGLMEEQQVSIRLFGLTGQLMANVQEWSLRSPGAHHFELDGSRLAPGVYLLAVQIGEQMHQRRLVVVR